MANNLQTKLLALVLAALLLASCVHTRDAGPDLPPWIWDYMTIVKLAVRGNQANLKLMQKASDIEPVELAKIAVHLIDNPGVNSREHTFRLQAIEDAYKLLCECEDHLRRVKNQKLADAPPQPRREPEEPLLPPGTGML